MLETIVEEYFFLMMFHVNHSKILGAETAILEDQNLHQTKSEDLKILWFHRNQIKYSICRISHIYTEIFKNFGIDWTCL